ncbi:hypothetical protein [Methanosarcina sp. 1.H.A.2.2]|nr:hypothetical protein [Methanosarcina sp. 1.H.A.2.2]
MECATIPLRVMYAPARDRKAIRKVCPKLRLALSGLCAERYCP